MAEEVTKDGQGTEADEYMVKLGCYRLQVTLDSSITKQHLYTSFSLF